MQPKARKLLWDVAEACADIARLTDDLTLEAYAAQQDLRRLVERYLLIVGEALRQLTDAEPSVVSRITALRQWVNLRNVIAQSYDSVDDEIIWRTCRGAAPLLRMQVIQLMDESEERPQELSSRETDTVLKSDCE
jgi:uncharacterized protein with HEPN domain